MDEKRTKDRECFWACKKYCPRMVVLLPKFVTVGNPKLGIMSWIITLLVIVIFIVFFFTNNEHLSSKAPKITISVCGSKCLPSTTETDQMTSRAFTQFYCDPNQHNFDIKYGTHQYNNIQCVGRCQSSSAAGAGSCMYVQERVHQTKDEVFFPTFYQEDTYVSLPPSGSCPPGGFVKSTTTTGNTTSDICKKQGNYFLAGATENRLVFSHEFEVSPDSGVLDTFLGKRILKSHSGSFQSKGWDKGMVSILFNGKGEQQARFNDSTPANMTVDHLLSAASYSAESNSLPLNMDLPYTDLSHKVAGVPMRISGAHLTVDLYVTDSGECPLYDMFRKEMIYMKVPNTGPVTCISVFASRRWLSKETVHRIGSSGQRHRKLHGIQVNFRKFGKVDFLDTKDIFTNITVFFVWINIPLYLTTLFCVFFLGKLSSVYSRVLYQELNLKEACKGFMARLMHHSAAFMDLQDHEKGISKQRIRDRFKDFLLDNEDIDEQEMERFVEFVFDGLKGTGNHPSSDRSYVSLQEFCEVCSSNEPLDFQALVRLFDNDRKLGRLESFFLDPSLRESQKNLPKETLKIEPVDFTKVSGSGGIRHSCIETASREVEDMMRNVKTLEQKAYKTATNLEIGEEVLGLTGAETESTATEAKLDQRESFCSIADEEDENGAFGDAGAESGPDRPAS